MSKGRNTDLHNVPLSRWYVQPLVVRYISITVSGLKDFHYHTPTEVVFGKDSEKEIGNLVKKHGANKVLVHYGGKSAEISGLLDVVRQQLDEAGIPFIELGGVVPNPILSKVHEGVLISKKENVDFILAVGGGSVIDSAKAIAYGLAYDGDVWDFFSKKADAIASCPVGVVFMIIEVKNDIT